MNIVTQYAKEDGDVAIQQQLTFDKNRFVIKELVVTTQQILFILRYLTDN
jgi:hypothetical protein